MPFFIYLLRKRNPIVVPSLPSHPFHPLHSTNLTLPLHPPTLPRHHPPPSLPLKPPSEPARPPVPQFPKQRSLSSSIIPSGPRKFFLSRGLVLGKCYLVKKKRNVCIFLSNYTSFWGFLPAKKQKHNAKENNSSKKKKKRGGERKEMGRNLYCFGRWDGGHEEPGLFGLKCAGAGICLA